MACREQAAPRGARSRRATYIQEEEDAYVAVCILLTIYSSFFFFGRYLQQRVAILARVMPRLVTCVLGLS